MKRKYQVFIAFTLMALVLMFISFVGGVYLMNKEHLEIAAWAEQTARAEVEHNVRHIMSLYNCNDEEIFQAIMESFDPVLVAVIIAIESEYRVNAISHKNCRGLMQLSPDKLDDWMNKKENIRVGSSYLNDQLIRFGNIELAVAAYNCGPERVARNRGVPPIEETQNYINQLRQWFWYLHGTGAEKGVDIVKLTRGNAKKVAQK